jgi:hypothetical protein
MNENDKVNQQVREVITDYDAAHPHWRQERRDREIKEAEERARRAQEAQRQVEQQHRQQVASNSKAWCDWVDQRIGEHFEARVGRLETHLFPGPQGERPILHDAIGNVISQERKARAPEIKTAIDEVKHWVEGRLGVLEGRIAQQIGQYAGRADSLGGAIEKERADRRGEIDSAIEEVRHALEEKTDAKLAAFEARVNALLPAKLPVAKAYRPDTVHYAGQVIVHRGATYQAARDTAHAPPHDDWTCLARAGRDAITPKIRGTFDAREQYCELDIVVFDGATGIARRDNPGICPGDGWQLMSKQGKTGRPGTPGERGPRGERGEKGDPGVVPQLVSSKLDENYNLTILRSDESLEIIPLREGFERFYWEFSE